MARTVWTPTVVELPKKPGVYEIAEYKGGKLIRWPYPFHTFDGTHWHGDAARWFDECHGCHPDTPKEDGSIVADGVYWRGIAPTPKGTASAHVAVGYDEPSLRLVAERDAYQADLEEVLDALAFPEDSGDRDPVGSPAEYAARLRILLRKVADELKAKDPHAEVLQLAQAYLDDEPSWQAVWGDTDLRG